jgi:NAD(P)-dependent dehydrogenase (short-subunit alcohol dehydrogenase family)
LLSADDSGARGGGIWPSGSTVLVTGASSGLGRQLCKQLIHGGAQVHILVHPRHQGGDIEGIDTDVIASITYCDLADPSVVADTTHSLARSSGKLDTLILCAAMGAYGPVADVPWERVRETLEVNYLANVILVREFLPFLKRRSTARIIFVGSGSALIGLRNGSPYTASKAALFNFFEALWAKCKGTSVKVLHVMPGYMDTPLHTKQKRFGSQQLVPPTGKPIAIEKIARSIVRIAKRNEGNVINLVQIPGWLYIYAIGVRAFSVG